MDSERAQYWLGVGAQPTEQVAAILKVTGDWAAFKGEEGAEGSLKTKDEKKSAEELVAVADKQAAEKRDEAKKAKEKAAAAESEAAESEAAESSDDETAAEDAAESADEA